MPRVKISRINKNNIWLYLSLSKHKLWLSPLQYITTVYHTRADLPGNNTGLYGTGSTLDLQLLFELFSMNACLGGFLALYAFPEPKQGRKEGCLVLLFRPAWMAAFIRMMLRKTIVHSSNTTVGTLNMIALSLGVCTALFLRGESFVRLWEVMTVSPQHWTNTYITHQTLEDHKFSLQSVHLLAQLCLDLSGLLGALSGRHSEGITIRHITGKQRY